MKIYRVRQRSTGLFSTGRSNPRWTKNGRVFASINAAKNHIYWLKVGPTGMDEEGGLVRLSRYLYPPLILTDYELVEYTCEETNSTLLPEL
jgi:hypothetical protein